MNIGIVGPCAVGKSSLADALSERGFEVRQIVQEHSYVPDMWQRISRPDVLLYLGGSYETCSNRRRMNWTESEYREQLTRLEHARNHCDVYIETDNLSEAEVVEIALAELTRHTASKR